MSNIHVYILAPFTVTYYNERLTKVLDEVIVKQPKRLLKEQHINFQNPSTINNYKRKVRNEMFYSFR